MSTQNFRRSQDVLKLQPRQSSVYTEYTADCVCCGSQQRGLLSMLNDAAFVAMILVFVGTFCQACFSVAAKELVNIGFVWSQDYFLSQLIVVIMLIILHGILLIYHYIKRDNCWLENGPKSVVYPLSSKKENYSTFAEYKNYILYIFADRTEKDLWKIIIFRGIMFSLNMICFFNAFLYCTSGDVLSLRTMLSTFGFVFLGIIKFDEKISCLTTAAFVIAVIGVILICHPSFLFGTAGISWIGVMFIVLGSIFRVADKSGVKLSNFGDKTNQTHWLGLAIVTYGISACIGLVIVIVSAIIVALINISNGNTGEYLYDDYVWNSDALTLNNQDVAWLVIICSVFMFFRAIANTIGYQTGDLSKVGIIANGDVLFAYVLQAEMLDVTESWYVYFGALLIVIGALMVFGDEIQNKRSTSPGGLVDIYEGDEEEEDYYGGAADEDRENSYNDETGLIGNPQTSSNGKGHNYHTIDGAYTDEDD